MRAAASAITAGSGRGTARPDRMAVASAVRMTCASSLARLHDAGGTRIWVRGAAFGSKLRHSIAPKASWRRAVIDSCAIRTNNEGSR
ncbi:Uncharacterised protein [Mycobacterium tuberculosis]|nr:Uncharacterised protein [Mycobacterium tuberculosis]CKS30915.1 Uncharacterised protein [Mycobacterium tuberculosis]CKU50844.1 Uncharacterised protein [Mycobacterium tuberculosis]COX37874.1 Uncharacterised protein [Mycobacterium tuberculosis]COX47583.1 Uncharacterised protein [Mycobacterium tuberculosis]